MTALLELPGIDTTGWQRVGGTSSGGYFLVAPDVLVAVPHQGLIQTEQRARASLDEFARIARERGRRHAAIILVDRVASQDSASRRVWSEASDAALRCATALVCSSLLARAIGSFYFGLRKSTTPTQLFADYPAALAWAREMIERHGGPI